MTQAAGKPDLGRFGSFGRGVTPQQAKDIEALGYGAVWVGGSPPAELAWVEPLLEATTTLQVATGIVNIWTAPAGPVAESFHRIEAAYPGRFLLGIGVGHPEAHTEYRKPYDALADYLTRLDEYGVPAGRRVVAALGRGCSGCPPSAPPGAPLPDHARAHRPGPRAHRPVGLPGARAQGGADHRRGARPGGRPQGARHLLQPRELPKQLEAAGFHRRRDHPAGQRPLGRRAGGIWQRGPDRRAAARASGRRRRPRARAGADQG
ncbi:luciferase-like monooxygenase family protein [Mycobacterium avium subsp. avium 2285 (R)]|nr:luciferase-like monooxygenase family protein [Mycobacterium avium subsp. avium 2285 (R)]